MAVSERPIILITGGSSGIGAAIARAAGPDYRVAISYRENAEGAARIVAEIEATGGEAFAVRADQRTEAEVMALFEAVDARFGRLDCLVNNAALTAVGDITELTQDNLENILRSNLIGPMLCAREAARRLSTAHGGRGGSIINVSSQSGTYGGIRLHGYAASKGGLTTFTIGLARELTGQGIRVNAVSPGVVDSGLPLAPERRANLEIILPMHRICRPEEVAAAVLWLASPAASYISGAILPVHGAR